jgi:hypothetical protein
MQKSIFRVLQLPQIAPVFLLKEFLFDDGSYFLTRGQIRSTAKETFKQVQTNEVAKELRNMTVQQKSARCAVECEDRVKEVQVDVDSTCLQSSQSHQLVAEVIEDDACLLIVNCVRYSPEAVVVLHPALYK